MASGQGQCEGRHPLFSPHTRHTSYSLSPLLSVQRMNVTMLWTCWQCRTSCLCGKFSKCRCYPEVHVAGHPAEFHLQFRFVAMIEYKNPLGWIKMSFLRCTRGCVSKRQPSLLNNGGELNKIPSQMVKHPWADRKEAAHSQSGRLSRSVYQIKGGPFRFAWQDHRSLCKLMCK